MMPGIGFEEMVIFGLLAIVVIGPKDLPLMMRKFGRFTGKLRAMAFEFKQGFDELGRQAELEELRKEVASLKKHTGLDDLQNDLRTDQASLGRDVDTAMRDDEPAPAYSAPLPYPGLSPTDPGYDAGCDPAFPAIGDVDPAAPETSGNGNGNGHGHGLNGANGHAEPPAEAAPPPSPAPVAAKQDQPA